jgi:hypothetical protein
MVQMMGQAFPWLAEHMKESAMNCSLPHANASLSNDHCGPEMLTGTCHRIPTKKQDN